MPSIVILAYHVVYRRHLPCIINAICAFRRPAYYVRTVLRKSVDFHQMTGSVCGEVLDAASEP